MNQAKNSSSKMPAQQVSSTMPPHSRTLMRIAVMACLSSLIYAPASWALGLGSASTTSSIGGPLRVEIKLEANDPERIDLSCIRLVGAPAGSDNDIPWVSNGSLSFEQTGQGRKLIITARASNHPALMLGLRIECGVGLRRDYALLLNPPKADEAVLARIPTPTPITSTRAAETESAQAAGWVVQTGDTARGIADRLIPVNRNAQRLFAHSIMQMNAALLNGATGTLNQLPVGATLQLPPLVRKPNTPKPEEAKPAVARSQAPAPSPRTETRAVRPSSQRDRLLVSAGGETPLRMATAIGERKELGEDQRSRLRVEMQLIATLDEKIATQIELTERLRQLEAMQAQLKLDTTRLEGELQNARSQQAAASAPLAEQSIAPAAQSELAPTARLQKEILSEKTSSVAPTNPWFATTTFILSALLAIASLIVAALWFARRNRQDTLDNDSLLGSPPLRQPGEDVAEHLIEPLSEADIWPDEEGHAPKISPRQINAMEGALGHFSASGLGPASLLQIVDDDVEEHDSAIELAEIMMSFGRVHGAAQTLADFIRSNPKQAVKPWIKLLEVYRSADMRTEFDALTAQLNKTFNVKSVSWDDFTAAQKTPESLESMPHILAQLDGIWGKRECQTYLHSLLRDNRQGSRQGFPLAIVDEILMLLGVLEGQLGPYRPDPVAEESTNASKTGLQTSANSLNIAPITFAEPLTEQTRPLATSEETTLSAPPGTKPSFSTTTSIHQLDFELDMTDLSKTLHLNLDDLNEDGNFTQTTDHPR